MFLRGKNLISSLKYLGDYYDEDTSELDLKHLMHNLVLWLEYCNKTDYPYINISAELGENDDLKELFITLFIKYLEAAFDRGMFYKYEDVVEDCKTIKGKPNIKDYLLNKYPNGTQDKLNANSQLLKLTIFSIGSLNMSVSLF